jgi:hypothetical protein
LWGGQVTPTHMSGVGGRWVRCFGSLSASPTWISKRLLTHGIREFGLLVAQSVHAVSMLARSLSVALLNASCTTRMYSARPPVHTPPWQERPPLQAVPLALGGGELHTPVARLHVL